MKKQYQNGSALIVVIIILVIAILGTLGFLFWQNLNSKTNQPETAQVNPDDTDENEGYLVLEDWGVRFKIAPALDSTEVKYSLKNDTYAFTTSRIEALGGECTKAPFNVTVSLTRYTENPGAGPMTLLNTEPINGYYYATYGPPASCSGFDTNGDMQAANQIEIDDRAALKETLATISSAL
jgi:hypothetical protein